ncbi:MAG: hypothetical protein Q7J25_03820 [Vicinamibacterales bacterium]|nr:hypothetical protein [Vicinamibacterales bacterium]
MAKLYLGLARARLGPAAAIIDPRHGVAACEENRLTRARQAPTSGPPALAIAELLSYLGHTESSIEAVGVVRDPEQPDWYQGSGLGWKHKTPLAEGIRKTYDWFLANHAVARGLAQGHGA